MRILLAEDNSSIAKALDFTLKSNGHTVTLTADENPFYQKIVIRDTGHGIDPKDLPHIFDRFYKSRHADENSVGIGLPLAKTIIEKSGGKIKAFSQPDKGTEFVIRFPRNL